MNVKQFDRPLHPYEQSFLLMSVLFARNILPDLLKLLPQSQSQRLEIAKDKFLKLERNERITLALLELKRLLLAKSFSGSKIHSTWINHALDNEPSYLRSTIKTLFSTSTNDENQIGETSTLKKKLKEQFVLQFAVEKEKSALFDPVIIRIPSMDDSEQYQTLQKLGEQLTIFLAKFFSSTRLDSFLLRRKIVISSLVPIERQKNQFQINECTRKYFLRAIIRESHKAPNEFFVGMGISAISFYVGFLSSTWQRRVAFSFTRDFGLLFNIYVEEVRKTKVSETEISEFAQFVRLIFSTFMPNRG